MNSGQEHYDCVCIVQSLVFFARSLTCLLYHTLTDVSGGGATAAAASGCSCGAEPL